MYHSYAAILLATAVRVLTRSYTAVRLATSEVPAVREAAFGSCARCWLRVFARILSSNEHFSRV
jgi:hypothetical protein